MQVTQLWGTIANGNTLRNAAGTGHDDDQRRSR
jgi:hypothetical protein